MRAINYLVLHCTATSQDAKVESILNYWKNTLGWRNPGYHYIIDKHGVVHNLLPIESVSNGVRGHNSDSINISFIGGVDEDNNSLDNRTPRQILSQVKLLVELKELFPQAKILGHRDFEGVSKVCPSFDAIEFAKSIKL